MSVTRHSVYLEVEGAKKAEQDLKAVDSADQKVVKSMGEVATATNKADKAMSSVSGGKKAAKEFEGVSDAVGKTLRKLNDVGDVFKVVGLAVGGGALFGGLQDIKDALMGVADNFGITRAAVLAFHSSTGTMTEGMAMAAAGIDNLKEHLDIYVASIGKASQEELTWSEKQQALVNIAKGRILTRAQLEQQAGTASTWGGVAAFVADLQGTLGIDNAKTLATVRAARIIQTAAEDRITQDAVALVTKRVSAENEKKTTAFYSNLYDFLSKGKGAKGGGARLAPPVSLYDLVKDAGAPSGGSQMQDSVLGLLDQNLASSRAEGEMMDDLLAGLPSEGGSDSERRQIRFNYLLQQLVATSMANAKAKASGTRGDMALAGFDARQAERALQKEARGLSQWAGAQEASDIIGELQGAGAVSPQQGRALLDESVKAIKSGDIDAVMSSLEGLQDRLVSLREANADTWGNMAFSMKSAFSGMAEQATNVGALMAQTVGVVTNAVGSMMTNLIVSGEAGWNGIKKQAGNALAGLSAQAFGYAVFLETLALAALLSGPILGYAAPGLAAGGAAMAGAGVVLAIGARALGADQLGAGSKAGAGGGGNKNAGTTFGSLAPRGDVNSQPLNVTVILSDEGMYDGMVRVDQRRSVSGSMSRPRLAGAV